MYCTTFLSGTYDRPTRFCNSLYVHGNLLIPSPSYAEVALFVPCYLCLPGLETPSFSFFARSRQLCLVAPCSAFKHFCFPNFKLIIWLYLYQYIYYYYYMRRHNECRCVVWFGMPLFFLVNSLGRSASHVHLKPAGMTTGVSAACTLLLSAFLKKVQSHCYCQPSWRKYKVKRLCSTRKLFLHSESSDCVSPSRGNMNHAWGNTIHKHQLRSDTAKISPKRCCRCRSISFLLIGLPPSIHFLIKKAARYLPNHEISPLRPMNFCFSCDRQWFSSKAP